MPLLFQTTNSASNLLEEMLATIDKFHEDQEESEVGGRKNSFVRPRSKKREQILGDMLDLQMDSTHVERTFKKDETRDILLSVLKRHFLFSKLSNEDLEDILDSMESCDKYEGEKVIEQGAPGDHFYIIEGGEFEVIVDGEVVSTLEEGFFGDLGTEFNCIIS